MYPDIPRYDRTGQTAQNCQTDKLTKDRVNNEAFTPELSRLARLVQRCQTVPTVSQRWSNGGQQLSVIGVLCSFDRFHTFTYGMTQLSVDVRQRPALSVHVGCTQPYHCKSASIGQKVSKLYGVQRCTPSVQHGVDQRYRYTTGGLPRCLRHKVIKQPNCTEAEGRGAVSQLYAIVHCRWVRARTLGVRTV